MAHARKPMPLPDQQPTAPRPASAPAGAAGDERSAAAGGPVGAMHVDLARRLASPPVRPAAPAERLVRFLSVAGGYVALAAGYVGVAIVLLR